MSAAAPAGPDAVCAPPPPAVLRCRPLFAPEGKEAGREKAPCCFLGARALADAPSSSAKRFRVGARTADTRLLPAFLFAPADAHIADGRRNFTDGRRRRVRGGAAVGGQRPPPCPESGGWPLAGSRLPGAGDAQERTARRRSRPLSPCLRRPRARRACAMGRRVRSGSRDTVVPRPKVPTT